ncbi:MAG: glutamine--fructose-6-phosphate transaminase (isomerizing) [Puniceicoccales bacterium]|nr:glutamine--fructose-6-phosphate transaminase (isomerizing) [Puniceicoccales bacterium]
MSGIVGYVGKANAPEILVRGLRKLEPRSYDSAGMAITENGGITVVKTLGTIAALEKKARAQWAPDRARAAAAGIAHTRWATHGNPSEANAHPHLDASGKIALVHNGILENYRALRSFLESKGSRFVSETDTEVLAHLVGWFYTNDIFQAVSEALRRVIGAYGIAAVSALEPDHIVTAQCGSSVSIGIGVGGSIVASDTSVIAEHTQRIISLDDNEVAIVRVDDVEVRNLGGIPVSRTVPELDEVEEAVRKNGFAHFMLKEIHEQPESITDAIRGRIDFENATAVFSSMDAAPCKISELTRVVMLGCGTSRHAGLAGEYAFEELADIQTEVEQASEFRYRNPILDKHDFAIAISQSGETADTLAALREAKLKGAFVTSICNVVSSTLAREAGRGVYLRAGPEISVASTKAFTSQVIVLLLMALKLGRGRRLSRERGLELANAIASLPDIVRRTLPVNDVAKRIAQKIKDVEHIYFIGRGTMYPVALEGALKVKETSYIHAEGYQASEMRHGPIAMLAQGTPVIALACCDEAERDKMIINVEECRSRGAYIIGVINAGDTEAARHMDEFIEIPATHPLVAPIPAVIALQLLAYHLACLRNCEIDKPRSLSKSLTVE